MLPFSFNIHKHLRDALRSFFKDIKDKGETVASPGAVKEYPRMPRVALPAEPKLSENLEETLKKRRSSRGFSGEMALTELGALLRNALGNRKRTRPYPSGGGLYPIETYVLVRKVKKLEQGVYHFRPDLNVLEYLWKLPSEAKFFTKPNWLAWADDTAATIIFTGLWNRNYEKYRDFGYYLGMLEAGHMAQNVLLAAATLNLEACPIAGFDDPTIVSLLDIDEKIEQPVYTVALGKIRID